jgi:hypothetical protein
VIERIISGGQTGADRGGLDAARALGIPHGGLCPKGRRTEDGAVPACYQLDETASASYQDRTRRNVLAADGTLIVVCGKLAGGSRLTANVAHDAGKPVLLLDMGALDGVAAETFRRWIALHKVRVLNVAGTRESTCPGMLQAVTAFLHQAIGAASK